MTFLHDLLSLINQVSHVHTMSFFYLCLEPNLFRLFKRNNKRERGRKNKKIIKLMKKHENKVKRNNAIIIQKTEK